MGSGKIPCFPKAFSLLCPRHSLFVGIGNFAETADFTIYLGGECAQNPRSRGISPYYSLLAGN
jgi:hypothetical protein